MNSKIEVPLAASHPDHPVLTCEELLLRANEISQAIEQCGASSKLTTAVALASDLGLHLRRYFAAPVVERQPMAIGNLYRTAEDQLEIELIGNPKITDGMLIYTSPPELAELQATIARLTAENERLSRESERVNKSWHGMKRDLDNIKATSKRLAELDDATIKNLGDRLKAESERLTGDPVLKSLSRRLTEAQMTICDKDLEIERLKGGQGEPVACTSCDGSGEYIDAIGDWRGYCSCPAGIALKNKPDPTPAAPDGWRLVPIHPTMDMLDALMEWNKVGNVNAYSNILNASPDAASQPAPVSVLGLDVFKALEKVRGAPVLTTNQCYDLARELNSCLDKVKELNQ